MDAELNNRVLECLRGLDVGESISADGIADEIGEKLSDVYYALEDLENAKLVEMHPSCRRGSDPTYTLTPKGKRALQAEVPVKQEPKGTEDCACKFCGKKMPAGKLGRHQTTCGKNPNRPDPHRKKPAEPEPAPAPAEYAEAESNSTATIEHEIPEVLEQLNADVPEVPDEVLQNEEAAVRVARLITAEAIVLKGSPGMAAVLRLLSECQKAIADGADVHMSASIKIVPGLDVSVYLDVPVKDGEQCQQ